MKGMNATKQEWLDIGQGDTGDGARSAERMMATWAITKYQCLLISNAFKTVKSRKKDFLLALCEMTQVSILERMEGDWK